MRKLAIVRQRTSAILQEVLAHLSFVLLLQSIILTLVSIEVVKVALLSKVSHDFSRRVVEILLWLSISIELASVSGSSLLASRVGVMVLRWGLIDLTRYWAGVVLLIFDFVWGNWA